MVLFLPDLKQQQAIGLATNFFCSTLKLCGSDVSHMKHQVINGVYFKLFGPLGDFANGFSGDVWSFWALLRYLLQMFEKKV